MLKYIKLIIIFYLSFLFLYKGTEHFSLLSLNEIKYKEKKIKGPLKQDLYMNFLGDLNNSFKTHIDKASINQNLPIKQKIMCDDNIKKELQTKALNDAFHKIPNDSKEVFDSPVFDNKHNELDFVDSSKNKCLYKAHHISEYTDPMFYLSETKNFPPRWIFKPYKDIPLPKHTNLKQWSNMYNCCKNNF